MTLPSHDALSRLARDDPQSFENLRLELIESCINGARETIQLRLRQLQFRIDGIRKRSRSPLGAAIKIQALMWDSFLRMDNELQAFGAQTRPPLLPEPPRVTNTGSGHRATILPFAARLAATPLASRP